MKPLGPLAAAGPVQPAPTVCRWLGAMIIATVALLPRDGWCQIVVTTNDSPLVLRDDAHATVTATRNGTPIPAVHWHTQIGHIDDGQYQPDDRRAPAFAIVAASTTDGHDKTTYGATILSLFGSGVLPTKTSARARVHIVVKDQTFGPATANRRGKASIAVQVPPSVTRATVVAVDRRGRTTRKAIALPSRPFPLALVVAPKTLTTSAKTKIAVFAITEDGQWRDEQAPLRVDGDNLRVHALAADGPGRWIATVEAKADGPVTLVLNDDAGSLATVSMTAKTPPVPIGIFHHFTTMRTMGVRFGLASAFDGLISPMIAAELAWPLWRLCSWQIGGVVEVLMAHGKRRFGQFNSSAITQLHLSAGGVAHHPLGNTNVLSARLGVGMGRGSASVKRNMNKSTATSLAPLLFAGVGVATSFKYGVFVVDLRWVQVAFADSVRTGGISGLGLWLSAGVQRSF